MGRPKHLSTVFLSLGMTLVLLSLSGFSWAYYSFLHHYQGTHVENPWREEDPFEPALIHRLEKKPNEDFVILNLADIQLCDLENLIDSENAHRLVNALVEKTKPDLITLTGDQTWSNENLISLRSILSWLESYKVPYAPIFGNHDHGNAFSSAVAGLEYCCDLYESMPHCLFRRGPSNLGNLGNYVVNIVEEGTPIQTLYFLDLGYLNRITEEQASWFAWNADGLKQTYGSHPRSAVFIHKELPEYREAYDHFIEGTATAEGNVYRHYGFAHVEQTGFATLAKEHGVTDFFCGHEHGNSFTILDDGARYTFCLKTGEFGGTYQDDHFLLSGATSITLKENDVRIERHFASDL